MVSGVGLLGAIFYVNASYGVVRETYMMMNYLIADPPGEPIISGYERGKYLEFGAPQRLMCKSTGGNPLANLTWYINDDEVGKM